MKLQSNITKKYKKYVEIVVKLWLYICRKWIRGDEMRRILLTSHSRLASGLKETLEFFLGQSDEVVAVNAYVDASSDYMSVLQSFVDNAVEGQTAIFTDIYGGSVNQQVTAMVVNSGKHIPIITGMNLPIVLSVALSDECITADLVLGMINECIPQVVQMQSCESKEGDEDDFFS